MSQTSFVAASLLATGPILVGRSIGSLGVCSELTPAQALTLIGAQPLDSDLTAIAALSTTAYGRALLALADAAAARASIGAVNRAGDTMTGALTLPAKLLVTQPGGQQTIEAHCQDVGTKISLNAGGSCYIATTSGVSIVDYSLNLTTLAAGKVAAQGGLIVGSTVGVGGYVPNTHLSQFIATGTASPLVAIGGAGAIQLWKDSTPSKAALFGFQSLNGSTPTNISDYSISLFSGSSWAERFRIFQATGNTIVGHASATPTDNGATLQVAGSLTVAKPTPSNALIKATIPSVASTARYPLMQLGMDYVGGISFGSMFVFSAGKDSTGVSPDGRLYLSVRGEDNIGLGVAADVLSVGMDQVVAFAKPLKDLTVKSPANWTSTGASDSPARALTLTRNGSGFKFNTSMSVFLHTYNTAVAGPATSAAFWLSDGALGGDEAPVDAKVLTLQGNGNTSHVPFAVNSILSIGYTGPSDVIQVFDSSRVIGSGGANLMHIMNFAVGNTGNIAPTEIYFQSTGNKTMSLTVARMKATATAFQLRNAADSAFHNLEAGMLKLAAYTVASLPAAASNAGQSAQVTDSTVAASGNYGATVAGGGSNRVQVFCNGTNWIIA